MRALFSVFLLIIAMPAAAQDDGDVMDTYRAYKAAVEAGDDRRTQRYAKEAYELAETHWGSERKETAILATNHADQLSNRARWRDAIKIYDRCVEILQNHDNSLREQIYCRMGAANAHRAKGDVETARAALTEVIHSIESIAEQEQWAAAFAGEAYLRLAMLSESRRPAPPPRATATSGDTSTRIRTENSDPDVNPSGRALALKAIFYFEIAYREDMIIVAQAHRVAGNYAEFDEDYGAAEAHYQAAYEILKSKLGETHPDTLTMEGRVALMQVNTMEQPVRRKPTREPSSDRCSIVVRGDLDIEVCRDKRYPPYFPNEALFKDQQGFVLVRFDITKEGRAANARVILSWPGGIFDERTLDAVGKWKYFPPTDQYGNIVAVSDIETKVTFKIGG